jgi:hypothetical protein
LPLLLQPLPVKVQPPLLERLLLLVQPLLPQPLLPLTPKRSNLRSCGF